MVQKVLSTMRLLIPLVLLVGVSVTLAAPRGLFSGCASCIAGVVEPKKKSDVEKNKAVPAASSSSTKPNGRKKLGDIINSTPAFKNENDVEESVTEIQELDSDSESIQSYLRDEHVQGLEEQVKPESEASNNQEGLEELPGTPSHVFDEGLTGLFKTPSQGQINQPKNPSLSRSSDEDLMHKFLNSPTGSFKSRSPSVKSEQNEERPLSPNFLDLYSKNFLNLEDNLKADLRKQSPVHESTSEETKEEIETQIESPLEVENQAIQDQVEVESEQEQENEIKIEEVEPEIQPVIEEPVVQVDEVKIREVVRQASKEFPYLGPEFVEELVQMEIRNQKKKASNLQDNQ